MEQGPLAVVAAVAEVAEDSEAGPDLARAPESVVIVCVRNAETS